MSGIVLQNLAEVFEKKKENDELNPVVLFQIFFFNLGKSAKQNELVYGDSLKLIYFVSGLRLAQCSFRPPEGRQATMAVQYMPSQHMSDGGKRVRSSRLAWAT